jgi:membrane dipeptidase
VRPFLIIHTPRSDYYHMPIIVDAHEDLANNILALGRDYTRSAAETRLIERGTPNPERNGDALLGWPDYQRGMVAVVFGTLFASPRRLLKPDQLWDNQVYNDIEEAHRLYWSQLEAYERLFDQHPDKFRRVDSRSDLKEVLAYWMQQPSQEHEPIHGYAEEAKQTLEEEPTEQPGRPVGVVILMEGAEGIRTSGELEDWWAGGVRIIGPAWGSNQYCGGTHEPGPLTRQGYALLEAMAGLGFILDLSHMDVKAALQSLDVYPGTIIASHANPLGMLPGSDSNRHLPDSVIRGLIERDGVIGIVPYNLFLKVGWVKGDRKDAVSLRDVVAHIDYICQMAGDALHVGLGSDFEGGFGLQSTPAEVESIADLQKLGPLLSEKGYNSADIEAILGGNWIRMLENSLPE